MTGMRSSGLESVDRSSSRSVTPREARAWFAGLDMEDGRVRAMISWDMSGNVRANVVGCAHEVCHFEEAMDDGAACLTRGTYYADFDGSHGYCYSVSIYLSKPGTIRESYESVDEEQRSNLRS